MLSSALKRSTLSSSRVTAASRLVLSRGFAKEIKFGVEGRAAMLRGVDTLADAVQVRTKSPLLRFVEENWEHHFLYDGFGDGDVQSRLSHVVSFVGNLNDT
jgi:hypothetical protein